MILVVVQVADFKRFMIIYLTLILMTSSISVAVLFHSKREGIDSTAAATKSHNDDLNDGTVQGWDSARWRGTIDGGPYGSIIEK